MGTPHPVTCPSGLVGEVRGFKTKEANILADTSGVRKGTTFDSILKACWLGTSDPSLYALDSRGELDWQKVLVCDRFYALLQVRAATYGPLYEFGFQCSSEVCREKFEWEVDLNELKVKMLPEASKTQFRTENKFQTKLGSTGRAVWFKLLTGSDETKSGAQRAKAREQKITLSLATRIVDIDGVHPNDKMRFLDDLELQDARDLIEAMDEVDGGVDTDLEVECTHCGHIQLVSLPFGREFYLPSTRPKKKAGAPETAVG